MMNIPAPLRDAMAGLLLAGCAPMHQIPRVSSDPDPIAVYEPAVQDCITNAQGRTEALRACLADLPSPNVLTFPESTLPIESQSDSLGLTAQVYPERPAQFPAHVEIGEGEKKGANVTYQGRIATVRPEGAAMPLRRDDLALAGSISTLRAVRPNGQVIEVSQANRKPEYPGGEWVEYIQVDFWSPEGAWGQWEAPFPSDTQKGGEDYMLGLHPLTDGRIAFVVGDYNNDNHGSEYNVYLPGKASLLVGGWDSSNVLQQITLGTKEEPVSLNGGFVEIDERTWLVSAAQGIFITRNAGAQWEKTILKLPEGYPLTEDIQSYHIHQEGVEIHLSLAYAGRRFANYKWDSQHQQWAYTGGERLDFQKIQNGGAWSLKYQEGEATTYQVERILGRSESKDPLETVKTHSASLSVQHHKGAAPLSATPGIHFKYYNGQFGRVERS